MNPTQQQPMEDPRAMMEHILVNGDNNAKTSHSLQEHSLVKQDEHSKMMQPLMEHQLVKADEISKGVQDTTAAVKEVVSAVKDLPTPEVGINIDAPDAEIITLKGDTGEVGPQGAVGPK